MPSYIPNPSMDLPQKEELLWSTAIGRFVLGFGHIEFCSQRWIQHFATDPLIKDLAIEATFSNRLKLIKKFIQRAKLPPDISKQALKLWKETEKLSETRNTIAHNSLVSGVDKKTGKRAWGIGNIKCMKGPGPFTIPLIQLSTIMKMTNRIFQILVELDNLLAEKSQGR